MSLWRMQISPVMQAPHKAIDEIKGAVEEFKEIVM